MNVLIDIAHPAHVHFYRHLRSQLLQLGADVLVTARDKDVTLELLRTFEIPHLVFGRAGHRTWTGQFIELVTRDAFLVWRGRRFQPDVVLTRNPTGVHAARALRAIGVFDTDDGRSAGVHFRSAAAFAHVITAPDCLPESFGSKERRYASYKSLAYLHPSVFTPRQDIRAELGLGANDKFSVLRLVAHDASHDSKARGIDDRARRRIVARLKLHGPVFVSGERDVPADLGGEELRIQPELMHDVLAAASMVVGDSQTIASEAGILATPSIRVNSWVDSSPHITEMERRYGLVFSYGPDQVDQVIERIDRLLVDPRTPETWRRRRDRMLQDKIDLTAWYKQLVLDLTAFR